MTASVRTLSPAEFEVLRDTYLRMLADSPSSFNADFDDEAGRDAASWREMLVARTWFVAEDDGEVVGLVCGGEPRREPDPSVRVLRSLWVAPTHRGQGVADALVDAVVTWAKSQGASVLNLFALEDASRAHAFYERYGFARGPQVREVNGQPHVPMTPYTLQLSDSTPKER